jgi:hypothetical protein
LPSALGELKASARRKLAVGKHEVDAFVDERIHDDGALHRSKRWLAPAQPITTTHAGSGGREALTRCLSFPKPSAPGA